MTDKLFVIDTHPAIPPADLLKEWEDLWHDELEHADVLLIKAFQAGADQELEACCKWLNGGSEIDYDTAKLLRAARRPKPLSLVKEALEAWERQMASYEETDADMDTIRRALERLQELEGGND